MTGADVLTGIEDPKPDDVLRRMLAMKPKPKEKGGEPKPAPKLKPNA